MADPLVSILIPAYRAGPYIGETLASIRAQTHTNWEILILEDGIFDNTADIAEQFAGTTENPVRLVQNKTNQGVSRARNAMLDAAQGEFIAFLDADDTWTPDHLEYSLERLAAENSDWIIGGLNTINSHGTVLEKNILPPFVSPQELPTRLLTYNFILPSGMVARSKVFAHDLRFDPSLSVGEDLDLCIRIVAAGYRASFSKRTTLNYRKHGTSATADPARFSEGMAQLFAKYVKNTIVDRTLCAKYLARDLTTTARLTRRKQPQRCLRAAAKLIKLRPWHPSGWIYWVAGLFSMITGSMSRKMHLDPSQA